MAGNKIPTVFCGPRNCDFGFCAYKEQDADGNPVGDRLSLTLVTDLSFATEREEGGDDDHITDGCDSSENCGKSTFDLTAKLCTSLDHGNQFFYGCNEFFLCIHHVSDPTTMLFDEQMKIDKLDGPKFTGGSQGKPTITISGETVNNVDWTPFVQAEAAA